MLPAGAGLRVGCGRSANRTMLPHASARRHGHRRRSTFGAELWSGAGDSGEARPAAALATVAAAGLGGCGRACAFARAGNAKLEWGHLPGNQAHPSGHCRVPTRPGIRRTHDRTVDLSRGVRLKWAGSLRSPHAHTLPNARQFCFLVGPGPPAHGLSQGGSHAKPHRLCTPPSVSTSSITFKRQARRIRAEPIATRRWPIELDIRRKTLPSSWRLCNRRTINKQGVAASAGSRPGNPRPAPQGLQVGRPLV